MLPLILFLFCVLFSCFIFAEGPLLLLLLPPRVRPCFLRVVVVAVFADGVASLSSLFFVFFFRSWQEGAPLCSFRPYFGVVVLPFFLLLIPELFVSSLSSSSFAFFFFGRSTLCSDARGRTW